MKRSYLYTWFGLIALTLLSYFFSEKWLSGMQLAIAIMLIIVIKFIAIGFQFMELKNADHGWKLLFISFIGLFSVIVLIIS